MMLNPAEEAALQENIIDKTDEMTEVVPIGDIPITDEDRERVKTSQGAIGNANEKFDDKTQVELPPKPIPQPNIESREHEWTNEPQRGTKMPTKRGDGAILKLHERVKAALEDILAQLNSIKSRLDEAENQIANS